MPFELHTENELPDLDAMGGNWFPDNGARSPNGDGRAPQIRSIEEIPNLEDVSSEPIQWAVDGVIPMAAVTMISSESGDGKTTVASSVTHAVSCGEPILGRACSKHPVLYLDCENSHSVVLERFKRLGIATHADFHYWGQWLPDEPPAAGGAIVWEWVARCNPKPVIIVDSLIGFHPGAENDSTETRRYMDQYRKLAAAGAAVVLLHHSGKAETSKDYRGSSDIKASVDVAYHLVNLSDDGRLGTLCLRAFKMRFSATSELVFRYVNGEFLVDERSVTVTVSESLVSLLKENSGIRGTEFELLAAKRKLGRSRARQFLRDGVRSRTVSVEQGENNSKRYSWAESCSSLI